MIWPSEGHQISRGWGFTLDKCVFLLLASPIAALHMPMITSLLILTFKSPSANLFMEPINKSVMPLGPTGAEV